MDQTKQSILIIEDETIVRNTLVDKFTLEGFTVVAAANGQEGLKLAKRHQPNIILLDILMPKMDGLTLLHQLRQSSSWGKTVPVIILTNVNATDEHTIQAVATDEPTFYLIKSDWPIDRVVERVQDCLRSRI